MLNNSIFLYEVFPSKFNLQFQTCIYFWTFFCIISQKNADVMKWTRKKKLNLVGVKIRAMLLLYISKESKTQLLTAVSKMGYVDPIEAEILSFNLVKKSHKSRNFYSIITKLNIHILIVRLHIQSKFEQWGSHGSRNTYLQKFKNLIKVIISILLSLNLIII